jgi:hypothetical protein
MLKYLQFLDNFVYNFSILLTPNRESRFKRCFVMVSINLTDRDFSILLLFLLIDKSDLALKIHQIIINNSQISS